MSTDAACASTTATFQSAPPVKGAIGGDEIGGLGGDVSIRAPREGGDSEALAFDGVADVSIRAPREGGDVPCKSSSDFVEVSIRAPREGGDRWVLPLKRGMRCFNPRPP